MGRTIRNHASDEIRGVYARKLESRIRRLAEARKSVLIYGPTGVGKDLLLRSYLKNATWGAKSTVINCAAIPKDLLEAELFGYTKGAFTGAHRTKRGLLESFDALALDEIGDAPEELQAKILRVMENGDFFRIGDTEPQQTDVVLIAATNKPDALRSDLLWRFAARVRVPPVAERRQDLVEILWAVARDLGIAGITERCLGFLIEEYEWPGNVREMRFVLDDAAETSTGEPIDLWDLPIPVAAYGFTEDRSEKWATREDPGPAWMFDESFTTNAIGRFPPKIDDDATALAFERLSYLAFVKPKKEAQASERRLYRRLGKAIDQLVAHALSTPMEHEARNPTAGDAFAAAVRHAPDWNRAAFFARRAWYEARRAEGRTRGEIAGMLDITPQALGQALRRYGIEG